MESMDRRKDEAIESTFQQVAANFEEIFEQLVPAGYGRMVIKRRQQVMLRYEKQNKFEKESTPLATLMAK